MTTQAPPGWYTDVYNPALLRWFDGKLWTERTTRNPKFVQRRVDRFDLEGWARRAEAVLLSKGVLHPEWDALWEELRRRGFSAQEGVARVQKHMLPYLHQVVAFAFADGIIEQHEMDEFELIIGKLGMRQDQRVRPLRDRMARGLALTKIEGGDLPRIAAPGTHVDPSEVVHLAHETLYTRFLPSGRTQQAQGRLLATSAKLRLAALQGGFEVPWSKIVEVRAEPGTVFVSATSAKGGGVYQCADPEYTAAVLSGAMKVAKRIVLRPGQRDSRAIPQVMRTEVWQRCGGKCTECGAGEYLEFDHIIPHSRGGATSVNNLQLLCRRCNQTKGARI